MSRDVRACFDIEVLEQVRESLDGWRLRVDLGCERVYEPGSVVLAEQMLTAYSTCLSVRLINSIGSSSNLSSKLCERDSVGSRTGERAPSSSTAGFSKMSSGRECAGLSGEIGDEIVSSVRGEGIVLALFLPIPGDVLDGSKRVKDFAVCTADGRDFKFPVDMFLDIAGREGYPQVVLCTFNNTGREVVDRSGWSSGKVVNKGRSF